MRVGKKILCINTIFAKVKCFIVEVALSKCSLINSKQTHSYLAYFAVKLPGFESV